MDTIRPYLELLYFITGGPLLALLAYFALDQIKVAKESLRVQSLREAYRLASEQVRFFASDVLPLIDKIDSEVKSRNITFLNDCVIDIKGAEISVKAPDKPKAAEELIPIAQELVAACNKLEAFAVFFTARVADEDVAFNSVGPAYVRVTRRLLPVMLLAGSQSDDLKNALGLFTMWHGRIEHKRIQNDLEILNGKLSTVKAVKIEPVGTSGRRI